MGKHMTRSTERISYRVRKSVRAKRLSLAVHCTGEVVLTLPVYTTKHAIEKFIHEKTNWILKQLVYYRQFDDVRLAPLGKIDYEKHKEAARALVRERIEYFSNNYPFSYNTISIRNQKTCWGSCSSKKNLNFNYKLIFLSPELRDYVIVHELCHLQELNHSKKFWNLVSQTIPNYKDLRTQLKKIL